MPSKWRLIDSGPVQPPESAALDEAILAAHVEGLVPSTLHFYCRSKPTISVGYFQRVSESLDLEECRRRDVAVIRRRSGGSSIYTDPGQLIYGLVVGEGEVPRDRAESFRSICNALAAAISPLGLDARYRPLNDIEVGGRKISGNAQLRRKGSLLQHGTVIVDVADPLAMDAVLRIDPSKSPGVAKPSDRVTSLSALLGRSVPMDLVKDLIARQFTESFGVEFERGALTEWERSRVMQYVDERYSRDDWNLRF